MKVPGISDNMKNFLGTAVLEAKQKQKIVALLSIARKSGVLFIGQDQLKKAKRKGRYLFVAAQDCSSGVLRFVNNRVEQGRGRLLLIPEKREELFGALGLETTQIVALPENHGLAQEIYRLLGGEGVGQQNSSV